MKVYESLKQKYKDATNKGIHLEYIELSKSNMDILQEELGDLVDIYARIHKDQTSMLNYVLNGINLPSVKLKK